MAEVRGGFGNGNNLVFPLLVEGDLPDAPNGYIDGGLACPSQQ